MVPLIDYVLNVMKFVDAILSNNSTDDHCREFVSQKGLVPLMGILGLPNLPVDFPVQPACQGRNKKCFFPPPPTPFFWCWNLPKTFLKGVPLHFL